ncbi:VirD4-like conjugal transfer protein, CD1115 family [Bifidobacterium miconisargentati]|uniref:VirD4-like conjugal transfer protein, CD1115 family n=1 Tax=Bifidobacterium miconisargentati TaxID=2834437 RepID=UPI001BDC4872|nr:type IV secretory system conjugative DNA transfer family protein [Bifidobacterium miconisargentati]MBW3089212.1 type IV secretory system conjugative DNA transfer family protein [Bifidobacterium miconisargentati]
MNRKTNPIAVIITMLLALWAGDLLGMQARAETAAGTPVNDMILKTLLALQQPFRFSLDRRDLLAGLGCAALVGLIWMVRWSNRRNYRQGEEYGTARWGDADDMAPYTDADVSQNIQMTRTEGLSLDAKATHRNINVLVSGSSGSGKTRSYVMPNIRRANMSFAITDPKGEIYRATSEMLAGKGYDVRKLDLVDLMQSDGFNPMHYINPDSPEASIMTLTENLIANTDSADAKKGGSDEFWTKAERALYNALITWVYYTSDNPSLNEVVDMVGKMEASETNENMMSEIDALMAAARDMIKEVQDKPDEWDDDVKRMCRGLVFACGQYRVFTQGAGETKKSIIISAGVRLAPMQMVDIRRILDHDTIGLDQAGHRKTAIYLIMSDTSTTFNFMASIFYQCLFESNIYVADHQDTGELPVPLHFYMDEFANIGQIPGFVQKLATIRSRRISCSIIIQNLAQLKSRYKDDWETIVGNCDSFLFLGGKEQTTTEFVSKTLGKATIDMRETSEQRGASGGYTVSYRSTGRELMLPDELAQMPDDHCVYLLRGCRPFYSLKTIPDKPTAKPKSRLRHSPDWRPVR